MKPERIQICGVPLDCVNMQSAVEFANLKIKDKRKCSIFAVNPEKVVAAHRDDKLKKLLQSSELLIPDGIGVVVAAKFQGADSLSRVPGCELALELCDLAAKNNYGVYLLGAKEETNKLAEEKLLEKFPSLKIVGRRNGYFSDQDYEEIVNDINQSKAHIVLVALGSPKQELWIKSNQAKLNANVLQGVGGTLDVIAGNVNRAPPIWRKVNLEWLYRLLSQPRRLFRQTALPVFVWRVLLNKIK